MELNSTTFILELINFAILVWLLKRFFYRPVMNAIDKRRSSIENTLQDALTKQDEAKALKQKYQARLEELDNQFTVRSEALDREIAEKRESKLAELEKEMQAEKERMQSLNEHEQDENWRALQCQAANLSARFVSQLLSKFEGPELEALIINRLISEIDDIPEDKKHHIADSVRQDSPDVTITSAYPLQAELKSGLESALARIAGDIPLSFHYKTDSKLGAGTMIMIDSFQIQASLSGEIEFFRETIHES